MARYLVGVFSVTAGLQEESLGSDEQEIVLFSWVVVDLTNTKVVVAQTDVVKPRGYDVNENSLSDVCRTELGLTEEQIKTGQPLEQVIEQLDQFVQTKLSPGNGGPPFYLLTDGQLHLRQVLHPEACHKNITLPNYYYSFFDIRKEFRKFYQSEEIHSIPEMLDYLAMEADGSADYSMQQVQNVAKIAIRLAQDGHAFEHAELINTHLEPGICTKNELVDNNTVVRARGLPWQSSDQDIAKFFRGLNIVRGGVALCLSAQGRRNGEALVRFESQEHRDMALKRHKHHIGQRYIEVYRATGDDFVNVAGGNNNEAQAFLSRGGQVIVRMRGLPYDCIRVRRSVDYISPFTKYSLFFFNFVFWLVGGAVFAIGSWSFLEEYNYKGLPEVNNAFELFVNVSIAVMVIGGIVFIISFAGCLGALRENTYLLKFYTITLLLLFLGEMVATIFAFVFPNQFVDALKEGLSKEPIAKYRDDVNLQNVIDAFQTEFQCCGVSDDGYKDWSKNIYFNCSVQNQSPERCAVPYSCCKNPHNIESGLINVMCGYQMQNASSVTNAAEFIFSRGCIAAIQEFIVGNLHLVAGIFLSISFVQLFAIYLCKSLLAQISAQLAQ